MLLNFISHSVLVESANFRKFYLPEYIKFSEFSKVFPIFVSRIFRPREQN